MEQRVVDSLEVTRARDDMKLLQHEVDVLENNRLHFEAELTAAKAKADSIEEVVNNNSIIIISNSQQIRLFVTLYNIAQLLIAATTRQDNNT